MKSLLDTIAIGARDYPIVFPVHPRTKKVMESIPSISEIFKLVEPQPYLEFNYLVKNAKAVITDSGGITEEATVFGVPCMTLRDSTERPETITIGTNELIGTSPENLLPALEKLFSGEWKRGSVPPLWDGKTADRIVGVLGSIFC